MVLPGHCRMEISLPDEQTISIVPPPALPGLASTPQQSGGCGKDSERVPSRESAVADGESWPSRNDAGSAAALALLFYATQLKENIMKKSLITIAVLGAMSSAALAQSNVTIYG